eukprot:TRINITY_DN1880_c0_g1_i8.p1 TRINITY_DN1880_c0_g1~~TRINITY_DN1880_c0_g1_i8.p1  ORF type:complete len:342 (-),score=79.88 TRINITY_DN1880_c0_g1_i8:125-1150(-)
MYYMCIGLHIIMLFFFFQAEDGIRDFCLSRGLGDVYKRQVQGWKKVNDAVHKKNGHIFLQIWHGGRAVHPANVGGKPGLAPSPIAIRTQVFTVQGIKPHMTPKEMTEEEIKQMIQDFRKGAENAMKAGFDGLELHGANGYIVDSFLRDHTNRRQDQWGGSVENRTRFCLEVVDQLVSVFGPNRVGVKVTPNGRYNDMFDSNPLKTYTYLAQQLSKKNIAYLHCAENDEDYISWVPNNFISGKKQMVSVAKDLRPHFKNTLVDNLGYGIVSADEAIQEGIADAISFGRAFMSNPDFVERIQNGWPLTEVDLSTSYLGGAKGYSDYPTYQQSLQQQQTKSHQY